ncbi:MAG: ASPIC/UnbV domain-containing protein [Planctomycetales bacterium]|nr:ASPIC/UnbV domain-containing protein [Planctomycetales bacterium]
MAPSPLDTSRAADVRNYIDSWRSVIHLVRSGFSWSGHEKNCVFLNCTPQSNGTQSSPQFVSAAAVSGLDLPDDGRAMALVDWDGDGDLDVWLHNRSAPRLRLMLNRPNEITQSQNGLTVRLVGTTCNRDAIGARAELVYQSSSGVTTTLVRSVRAGDAFLSQSTNLLHFGMPAGARIREFRVVWPGGDSEIVRGIDKAGRFEVRQGSGQALAGTRRSEVHLAARSNQPLAPTAAARVILPGKAPLPKLKYRAVESQQATELSFQSPTTLVTFWTSSCTNCCQELTEFSKQRERLDAASLDVVAICLDSIDPTDGTELPADDESLAASREFLRSIQFPFRSGEAFADTATSVRLFQNALFGKYPEFVVPLSLLVDADGYVVAIYRGAFPLESLLQDRELTQMDDATLRSLAPPVTGTWITKPATQEQFSAFIQARGVRRGESSRAVEQERVESRE